MGSGSGDPGFKTRSDHSLVLVHDSPWFIFSAALVNSLPPRFLTVVIVLGPVVQKPINANPRLKINQGVYFSTPKCFSTLIFGKTLHYNKLILKNRNKEKKLLPKS